MSQLALGDLDPKIAEALKPLLLRVPRTIFPHAPDPPSEWRVVADQARAMGPVRDRVFMWQGALVGIVVPLATVAPFGVLIFAILDLITGAHGSHLLPISPILAMSSTAIWTALCWWFILGTQHKSERITLEYYFTPEILQALRPMLTFSPMEDEYLDAVGALLKTDSTLGSGTAADLLRSLNELLVAGRRLEREQTTLSEAQAGQSIAQIEADQAALMQRIAATTDSIARATLSESLALCERRLARAQKLAPLQERIAAQLDGITQTMRSVQGSVASLRLLPQGVELEELQASARSLVQRTSAIENAVQEVLQIGR